VNENRSNIRNLIGIPDAASRTPSGTRAGFLAGLWHGFIQPLSRFLSFTNPTVRSHETRNTTRWYLVGYKIGAADPFAPE